MTLPPLSLRCFRGYSQRRGISPLRKPVSPTPWEICAGFDDETPLITLPIYINPYLAVPQNGTNTVSVIINPTNVASQIIFQSSDTNVATVTPAQATGSLQLISIPGHGVTNAITNAKSQAYRAVKPKH